MLRCSSLHVIQWVTVVLALVCGSSGFVLPSSQVAASHGGSALLPDVTHDVRTRSRQFDGACTTNMSIHRGGVSRVPARTTAVTLAASRGGQGEKETEDGVEEKGDGGIEPKYLAAICVFALAAFYDLFVTHEGRLWEL